MKETFIITGPSGVGKTYLSDYLTSHHPELFQTLNIVTTRKPRLGVVDNDRDFLSVDSFNSKVQSKAFFTSGLYNGNYYGFPPIPKNSSHNLIFNIWPELIPVFSKLEDVTIIALTVKDDRRNLIKQRLENRYQKDLGTLQQRLETIDSDLRVIDRNKELVNQHGKVFYINDNKSIHMEVIPYILDKLKN